MSELRFAPWLRESSKGVSADRLARPLESGAAQVGLVVLIRQVRDDQLLLGVIADIMISENARWYWILTKGRGRWLHERQVCDWEPTCPQCQSRRSQWKQRRKRVFFALDAGFGVFSFMCPRLLTLTR